MSLCPIVRLSHHLTLSNLTFKIKSKIYAGNYCFASEIFVLLHCQQSRRNLRPNWATKIAKRAGMCYLGKSQN